MGVLAGKVALVTGSSRGIGRATAERLARDGAAVVVNYVSNSAAADQVVAAIEAAGGQAVAVQADMADPAAIRRLFAQADGRFGGLDIVVSNVGAFVFKPLVATTEEEFDRVFGINARGAFFVLQEAARRVRDGGRIISISTGGTVAPGPNGSVYAGSKAAAEQFVFALSKELGARQITVNTVVPGITRTDGLVIPEEYIGQMITQTSLGRLGEPADIADVIGFLAGPDARWVTGQVLRAAGGLV